MMPALYISDIVINCTPPKESRLKHVRVSYPHIPIVLQDGKIAEDRYWSTIKRLVNNGKSTTRQIKDWHRYIITYELSNTKFSSNLYIKK